MPKGVALSRSGRMVVLAAALFAFVFGLALLGGKFTQSPTPGDNGIVVLPGPTPDTQQDGSSPSPEPSANTCTYTYLSGDTTAFVCGNPPQRTDGACTYTDIDGNITESTCDGAEPNPSSPPAAAADGGSNGDVSSVDTGKMPNLPNNFSHGDWTIYGANSLNGDDHIVRDWLKRLKNPDPTNWKSFPDHRNADLSQKAFPWNDCGDKDPDSTCAPNGLEYGQDVSPFCEQDEYCNWPVQGWHYRYLSGDFSFKGMTCGGDGGCMLVLINVSDTDWTWKDQSLIDGFTVTGRYWNGNKLDQAVWGLVSHGAANMLNMKTDSARSGERLNFGSSGANAGGNCGTVRGCQKVNVFVVVHAMDRILAVATTTVTRPN